MGEFPVVRKRKLFSSCRTQVKLFLCPIAVCLKPDDGEMMAANLLLFCEKCKECFHKNSYLPMTNLKKTVTGSVSITDYSAIVYRYYFLHLCPFSYYDKMRECISKHTFEIISNFKSLP